LNLLSRIGAAGRVLLGRSLEAAGGSGRWPRQAFMGNAADVIHAQRDRVARGASWLVENAPVASSISHLYVTSLIGDGPSTRSAHPNRAMAKALDDAWLAFYAQADVEGGGADLTSVLNRIAAALVSHGEAFVRFGTSNEGELRLQMLRPEQVDGASVETNNGGRIVSGVEFDAQGRRVAYHVREDPLTAATVRLPASEIAHCFIAKVPGQVRGLPILSSAATAILELDAIQDSLRAKLKVNALHCGFVRDLDGNSGAALGEQVNLAMEPGTVRVLPAGADMVFPPVGDFDATDAFLKHCLRSIASAVGVPYELAASDLSQTSYSSAKMGRENWERRCRALRSSVLESRFLLPCWRRFVATEVLSARINASGYARDPRPFEQVRFIWPSPAALDPYKESVAAVTLLRAGLASRQELIEQMRGRDFAEVEAEREADDFELPSGNVSQIGEAA
jgi:lambda family phage portal protein